MQYIRQQYTDNGIGRWAVIEKSTGDFVGWAGLKLRKDGPDHLPVYYDLGYRFIKRYWGLGYATEVSRASIEYAFNEMKLKELYAMADVRNVASRKVLEKVGMKYIETIDWEGVPQDWFSLKRI